MNKQRFERIRRKIDDYIKKRVEVEVSNRVSSLAEDYLKPLAERYLKGALEDYLARHLHETLESVLRDLESAFPDEVGDTPLGYNPMPENVSEEVSTPHEEAISLEHKALTLLAYIQEYQLKHQCEHAPRGTQIHKDLGLGGLDLIQCYQMLREMGRIEGPTREGRRQKLVVLKPLPHTGDYLT